MARPLRTAGPAGPALPAGRVLRLLGLRPEELSRTQAPAPGRPRPGPARLPRRLLRQPGGLRSSPRQNLDHCHRPGRRRFAPRGPRPATGRVLAAASRNPTAPRPVAVPGGGARTRASRNGAEGCCRPCPRCPPARCRNPDAGFQPLPCRLPRPRRMRPALHPCRRHLPGQPRAASGRTLARFQPGLVRRPVRRLARAVRRLSRPRRVPARRRVARTVPAPQRAAGGHAAHQGHAPARAGCRPGRAPGLRTANQPQGERRTADDYRPAPQRSGQGLRLRVSAGARPHATGTLRPRPTSGLYGGRPAARPGHPSGSAGGLLPGRQHHRRAQVPRHGDH